MLTQRRARGHFIVVTCNNANALSPESTRGHIAVSRVHNRFHEQVEALYVCEYTTGLLSDLPWSSIACICCHFVII